MDFGDVLAVKSQQAVVQKLLRADSTIDDQVRFLGPLVKTLLIWVVGKLEQNQQLVGQAKRVIPTERMSNEHTSMHHLPKKVDRGSQPLDLFKKLVNAIAVNDANTKHVGRSRVCGE